MEHSIGTMKHSLGTMKQFLTNSTGHLIKHSLGKMKQFLTNSTGHFMKNSMKHHPIFFPKISLSKDMIFFISTIKIPRLVLGYDYF